MIKINPYLILIMRLLIGIIFIYASYEKIINPAKFARDIANYHVVPYGLENTVAIVLPWLELFIGIGIIIGVIYFISGATTFLGGLLADRLNLKYIYLFGIFMQFPCYLGIAYMSDFSLIILCILAAVFNASILPTENILLGRFTPQKYHGVIYGIKFILAFGSGPIAVFLISEIYSLTLEFTYLFIINAAMMGIVSLIIIFLPFHNNLRISIQD